MNATTPTRSEPITVPRDASEIAQLLAQDFTRVLVVGRSRLEAADIIADVAAELRVADESGSPIYATTGQPIYELRSTPGFERLKLPNGSTLKAASATTPDELRGHQYDVVLLAPHVGQSPDLLMQIRATLATSRGGVIAWLPGVTE